MMLNKPPELEGLWFTNLQFSLQHLLWGSEGPSWRASTRWKQLPNKLLLVAQLPGFREWFAREGR